MATIGQHSLFSSDPSNEDERPAWSLLARACMESASSPADTRLAAVLKHAASAAGADRAFLVVEDDAGDRLRVEAAVSLRQDGDTVPSRSLLRRALATRRSLVCPDAGFDRSLSQGASVRSLGIRFVVALPLPQREAARAALVLDSRRRAVRVPAARRRVLEAFAALAALSLDHALPSRGPGGRPRGKAGLVGRSARFRQMLEQTRACAPWPFPVLVTGESGSGKEGVSRLLHLESPRARGPLVAINCAALPDGLLESELFGAARGAYTGLERDRPGLFRSARGGTILLDEVGDMSPAMQAKLLRVLQEPRIRSLGGAVEEAVDVRIVAATHRDLDREVREGRFRADLHYRLAMLRVHVPPLRERPEDLPLLVEHLLSRLTEQSGRSMRRVTPAALKLLASHTWPGNVRELEAVLIRALIQSGDGPIEPAHVELRTTSGREGSSEDLLERRMIEEALRECGGVVTRAAARIGWSRQKLNRRMAALGVRARVR